MQTSAKYMSGEIRGAVIVNILLGVWVIVSPFVLGIPTGSATLWNNVAVGAVVILIALMGGWKEGAVLGAIIPLATWLFTATFVLEFFGMKFLWSNVLSVFALIFEAAYGGALRSMPRP